MLGKSLYNCHWLQRLLVVVVLSVIVGWMLGLVHFVYAILDTWAADSHVGKMAVLEKLIHVCCFEIDMDY